MCDCLFFKHTSFKVSGKQKKLKTNTETPHRTQHGTHRLRLSSNHKINKQGEKLYSKGYPAVCLQLKKQLQSRIFEVRFYLKHWGIGQVREAPASVNIESARFVFVRGINCGQPPETVRVRRIIFLSIFFILLSSPNNLKGIAAARYF